MRKAGSALLLLTGALALVLGVTAGPASALYSPTTAPYTQTANNTALVNTINTTDAPSALVNGSGVPPRLPGIATAAEDAAFYDAEVAAGAAPALSTLGTIAVGVAAFAIGWQIGTGINHYFHISGSTSSGVGTYSGGALTPTWLYSDNLRLVAGGGYIGTLTDVHGWILECCGTGGPQQVFDSGSGFGLEDWNLVGDAVAASAGATRVDSSSPTAHGHVWIKTSAAMRAGLTITPESSTAYAAEPATRTSTHSQTTTASTAQAALENPVASVSGGVYHDSGGAVLTPEKVQTQLDVNCKLDASYCAGGSNDPFGSGAPLATTLTMPDCVGLTVSACDAALAALGFTGTTTYTDLGLSGAVVTKPAGAVVTQASAFGSTVPTTGTLTFTRNPTTMPVLLPQPLLNETYDDYLARLVTLGWLGVAVPLDLTDATAETQLGPSAPVRITVTTTVGTQTLSPLAWPATAPRINPTAGLSIARNPATVAPATSGPPPPGAGSGGGGSCSCPPLDLTPITGASVGSKFPFGLFTWVTHAIGIFDVSPTTPEVHFPVHLGSTSVHSFADDDFYVNLGFFDGYMSTMRLLLTFFMWAAAIWFVAAKFLKVDWAGEPGDGTEELL
jgi:hypothetical protein